MNKTGTGAKSSSILPFFLVEKERFKKGTRHEGKAVEKSLPVCKKERLKLAKVEESWDII